MRGEIVGLVSRMMAFKLDMSGILSNLLMSVTNYNLHSKCNISSNSMDWKDAKPLVDMKFSSTSIKDLYPLVKLEKKTTSTPERSGDKDSRHCDRLKRHRRKY